MRLLVRVTVVLAIGLILTSFASAQGRVALPASARLAADVAIGDVQRTVLFENIVHYQWTVRVGPGEHDVIGLHRVVKETGANQPASLDQAVMFFAGSPTYFAGLYLTPLISEVPARDRAIAIFLAKNDVDVWGMDYRWAMVPESTTDFRFMTNWGVLRDVEDGQIALTLARWIRGNWARPSGPLFASGLSYGAEISYAVAANDSQRPPKFQNVAGIIPLDYGLLFDSADYQAESCAYMEEVKQLRKDGVFAWDNRYLWAMGQLAIDDPSGESPFDPNFDNLHFALGVGGWPQDAAIPWHFAGSWLDAGGNPTGLRFTENRLFFDLILANEPPYIPTMLDVEDRAVACNPTHRAGTFANHVEDITVPVFYVGAAGGFGHWGDYMTTVVASPDVTTLIVQELPNDLWAEDYGHADLLTAIDAETMVWQPILDWIKAHK